MSNAKHTPGPWIVEQVSGAIEVCNEETLFTVARCGIGNGVSEANARLIAAAPELLAALERTADVLEYYNENKGPTRDSALCDLFAIARAAIAKAKGE